MCSLHVGIFIRLRETDSRPPAQGSPLNGGKCAHIKEKNRLVKLLLKISMHVVES